MDPVLAGCERAAHEEATHQLSTANAPAASPSTMATSLIRYAIDLAESFFQHSSGIAARMSLSVNGGAALRSCKHTQGGQFKSN